MIEAWRFYALLVALADMALAMADHNLKRAYRGLGLADVDHFADLEELEKAKSAGDDRMVAGILTGGYFMPDGSPHGEPSIEDRRLDAKEFTAFAAAAEAGRLADAVIEHFARDGKVRP